MWQNYANIGFQKAGKVGRVNKKVRIISKQQKRVTLLENMALIE